LVGKRDISLQSDITQKDAEFSEDSDALNRHKNLRKWRGKSGAAITLAKVDKIEAISEAIDSKS